MKSLLAAYVFMIGVAAADITTVMHPEQEFDSERTVVWSPLFQACWDHLSENSGGKLLKVEPPNPVMMKLANFTWRKDAVMPPKGWKIWSGPTTAEFARQVNEEASQMGGVPIRPFAVDADAQAGGGNMIFGLLDRDLPFRKAFGRSSKTGMEFTFSKGEKKQVSYFGSKGERSGEYHDDVRVLSYRPQEKSYALQILTREGDETVILYRPAKSQDFATACRWLREWRKQHGHVKQAVDRWDDRYLHEQDEVRVPYVSLQTEADLRSQLAGELTFKGNPVPQVITQAQQRTRFVLHEKGARVRVEVALAGAPLGGDPLFVAPPVPRKFHYDSPFFVFLWRDGADWPYFGAWIGNAEVLEQFKK